MNETERTPLMDAAEDEIAALAPTQGWDAVKILVQRGRDIERAANAMESALLRCDAMIKKFAGDGRSHVVLERALATFASLKQGDT